MRSGSTAQPDSCPRFLARSLRTPTYPVLSVQCTFVYTRTHETIHLKLSARVSTSGLDDFAAILHFHCAAAAAEVPARTSGRSIAQDRVSTEDAQEPSSGVITPLLMCYCVLRHGLDELSA